MLEGQQARLTQAALETLAIVAYKQPVSRARVSAIRGVNVDGVIRTLLTRGLVEEAGEDGEHGAALYRTTGYFLERIGVTSLDELPELAPYLPEMDDLEDELSAMAAQESPHDPPADRRKHEPRDRRRGPDPAAEAAGPVGRRVPPQVRGADAGRRGGGRRRGGHPPRHQGGPAHRGDPGLRQAAAAGLRPRLPRAQQAARRGLDHVRPRRAGARSPTWWPTARSGCSTSGASTPTPPACCCSPTTATSPSGSPTRPTRSTRPTSPRSRAASRRPPCRPCSTA